MSPNRHGLRATRWVAASGRGSLPQSPPSLPERAFTVGRAGDTSPIAPKASGVYTAYFPYPVKLFVKSMLTGPKGYDPRFSFGRHSTGGIASTAVVRLSRTYAPHIRILQTQMITAPGSPHAAQAIPAFLTHRAFSVKRFASKPYDLAFRAKSAVFRLVWAGRLYPRLAFCLFQRQNALKRAGEGLGGAGGRGTPPARGGGSPFPLRKPYPVAASISHSGRSRRWGR